MQWQLSVIKGLLTRNVLVNKKLLTETVLVNKKLLTGTVPVNNLYLIIVMEGNLDRVKCLLPDIPEITEVIEELDIVIHDVLINDIGDTLDNTVVITGVLLITFAVLQIAANSILLYGAVFRRRNLLPSVLITRLCFLSTFWGVIDGFRKSCSLDEMAVFLV